MNISSIVIMFTQKFVTSNLNLLWNWYRQKKKTNWIYWLHWILLSEPILYCLKFKASLLNSDSKMSYRNAFNVVDVFSIINHPFKIQNGTMKSKQWKNKLHNLLVILINLLFFAPLLNYRWKHIALHKKCAKLTPSEKNFCVLQCSFICWFLSRLLNLIFYEIIKEARTR